MTLFFFVTLHRIGFLAFKIFSIFSRLYSPMNLSFNIIRFSPEISNNGGFLLIDGDTLTFGYQPPYLCVVE